MKEFIFAALGRSCPVYAGLAAQVGLVPSIILVQLEFLTGMEKEVIKDGELKKVRKHINGFYKYLKRPSQDERGDFPQPYKIGDSWCEWIGCTPDVFVTGFKKIGVAYPSIKSFNEACELPTTEECATYMIDHKKNLNDKFRDPFEGKMYLSVIDHKTNLTHYYRNHGVADKFFADFCAGVPVTPCLKKKGGKPISGESKEETPDKAGPAEADSSQSPPFSPDNTVSDCLENKGETPVSGDGDSPSLRRKTQVSEMANTPLPVSPITPPITSPFTTDITKDIVIQREREQEKETLSLSVVNISDSASSQSQDQKTVLQAEAVTKHAKQKFYYTDDVTGIWIANQEDVVKKDILIERYDLESIKEAAQKVAGEERRPWATAVARELKPVGKKRESNLPIGKHYGFEKNDYRKGMNDDSSF